MTAVHISSKRFFAALENEFPAVEFSSYLGDMFFSQVRSVGDVLRNIMLDDGIDHPITTGFECDSEGLIDGATVGLTVLGDARTTYSAYLVKFLENKYLTDDREATGKESALAIKSALLDAYNDVRALALEKGLI